MVPTMEIPWRVRGTMQGYEFQMGLSLYPRVYKKQRVCQFIEMTKCTNNPLYNDLLCRPAARGLYDTRPPKYYPNWTNFWTNSTSLIFLSIWLLKRVNPSFQIHAHCHSHISTSIVTLLLFIGVLLPSEYVFLFKSFLNVRCDVMALPSTAAAMRRSNSQQGTISNACLVTWPSNSRNQCSLIGFSPSHCQ